MAIAAGKWSVPPEKLLRIANGVDLRRYGGAAGNRSPLAGCDIDPAAVVIGTVAPLRPEQNVGRPLHDFAALPEQPECVLLVPGAALQRAALSRLAAHLVTTPPPP